MTKIKICGLTNLEDALAACAAGADLLGFILYPKSPRYVAPEQVRAIVAGVRTWQPAAQSVRCVGVFVNAALETVSQVLEECQLDLAQLHGDEPPALLQALAGRGYRALRPRDEAEAQADAERFWPLGSPEGPRLLVDAYAPHAYGGTGQRADWDAAAALARRRSGLLLAGGLAPENVAEAVRVVQPWGVDVSSGVEARPGRKDHERLRAFITAVRAADTLARD